MPIKGPFMTTSTLDCTLPEKILLSAFQLEERGHSPFSAEALIVCAWQNYPATFGLKGYADQYPDANKVLASIMGEKGLAKRGWLAKMGQKLYSLTREGKQVVRRLQNVDEEEAAPLVAMPASLPAEQDKLFQTLAGSSAWQKYHDGGKADLNFSDACRFWSITENLTGTLLNQRLDHVGTVLHDLEKQVGQIGVVLGNGKRLTGGEIAELAELHDYLEDRFDRHLMLLRNRSERR
jgi:hypothetical protein